MQSCKKYLTVLTSFLLVGAMLSCGRQYSPTSSTSEKAETQTKPITIVACSDYQPSDKGLGKMTVEQLAERVLEDTEERIDSFFCCGDYDKNTFGNKSATEAGIEDLMDAVGILNARNHILIKGNHDAADAAGLAPSGNNDPTSDKYGVFVINESDYMWYNNSQSTVQQTANALNAYLQEKIEENYTNPVFVLSHLPLAYSMRTQLDGDGQYANYIFDVLNSAGEQGLDIFFLYGHDHSNGWDDYLGGAAVFLPKGDSILIAQGSKTEFLEETLEFTYLNAGFIGYYNNHNGADDALTMTKFVIEEGKVTVSRYDKNGLYTLKSRGMRNAYKSEKDYEPNETVYRSPYKVRRTAILTACAQAVQGEDFSYLSHVNL